MQCRYNDHVHAEWRSVMQKKFFWQSDCLSNLVILYGLCILDSTFLYRPLMYGGYLIGIACPFFSLNTIDELHVLCCFEFYKRSVFVAAAPVWHGICRYVCASNIHPRVHPRSQVHLRNKFHFSEVHGSMNAMGQVQSTLHGTRCVHTSMNLRKIKFISYIYTFTSFLFIICKILI